VAHLSDGALRRLFDDPNAVTTPEREHYTTCPECRARFDALGADARAAAELISVPAASFDAEAAYRRAKAQPAVAPRFGIRLPILRPRTQGTMVVLAAAVVLAVVATASVNVSQIFAPKTVEPVPVTVAELQSLPDLSAWGTVTWSQKPEPQLVVDAAAAAKVAGFQPPSVRGLPAGVSSTVTYAAMPQATGVFTFSAAKAAAAAAARGKTMPKLPAGLDGSSLTLTMGPAVVEIFGNLGSGSSTDSSQLNLPQLIVAESKAPVVSSTGVTVKQLEGYLLAQPGISPQLAAQIRAIGDPTTTLPIPVPIQFATSTKVKVHGVTGVALGDNTGLGSAVIWIKGGDVFFVGGTVKQSEVLAIANHLS
jgi:hypothetical protein